MHQALHQRITGLLGLPFALRPADDSVTAERIEKTVTSLWSRMAPDQVHSDMIRWSIMLGFAVAQIDYSPWDELLQTRVPKLKPWHPAHLRLDTSGQLFAQTKTGEVPVVPGNGQWVVYAPYSVDRSHMLGVVRAVVEWFKRSQDAGRDVSRWSEVHGQGTWLGKVPSGAEESEDGKAFLRSLRTLGRAGAIMLPQGDTPGNSWGAELLEAKGDGWQGFEFIIKTAAQIARLVILAQDLTSVDSKGGGYARSKTGNVVLDKLVAHDNQNYSACLTSQFLAPVVRYLKGRPDLAPRPWWDAQPSKDFKEQGDAMKVLIESVVLWNNELSKLGKTVDLLALAKDAGITLVDSKPENQ